MECPGLNECSRYPQKVCGVNDMRDRIKDIDGDQRGQNKCRQRYEFVSVTCQKVEKEHRLTSEKERNQKKSEDRSSINYMKFRKKSGENCPELSSESPQKKHGEENQRGGYSKDFVSS